MTLHILGVGLCGCSDHGRRTHRVPVSGRQLLGSAVAIEQYPNMNQLVNNGWLMVDHGKSWLVEVAVTYPFGCSNHHQAPSSDRPNMFTTYPNWPEITAP